MAPAWGSTVGAPFETGPYLTSFGLLFSTKNAAANASRPRPPMAALTPIPAFAPVESPLSWDVEEDAGEDGEEDADVGMSTFHPWICMPNTLLVVDTTVERVVVGVPWLSDWARKVSV